MRGARTQLRTRWILPLADAFGREQPVVLQVHDGHVFAQSGPVQLKMTPQVISDVRRVLAAAQAAAFLQRGGAFDV